VNLEEVFDEDAHDADLLLEIGGGYLAEDIDGLGSKLPGIEAFFERVYDKVCK
jgi:hypothetical protein